MVEPIKLSSKESFKSEPLSFFSEFANNPNFPSHGINKIIQYGATPQILRLNSLRCRSLYSDAEHSSPGLEQRCGPHGSRQPGAPRSGCTDRTSRCPWTPSPSPHRTAPPRRWWWACWAHLLQPSLLSAVWGLLEWIYLNNCVTLF